MRSLVYKLESALFKVVASSADRPRSCAREAIHWYTNQILCIALALRPDVWPYPVALSTDGV